MHNYYKKNVVYKNTSLTYKYSYLQDGLYTTHRLEASIISILKFIKIEELEQFDNFLDLGCGQGNWMSFFHKIFNGKINMHGVELSEYQINVLHDKYPHYNIEHLNMTKLSTVYEKNTFDLITAFTSFMFLKDVNELDMTFKEVSKVLKINKYFILEDAYKKESHFSGKQLETDGFCGYSIEELDEVAKKYGFEKITDKPIFKRLFWSKRSRLNTVNLPSYIGYSLTYLSELFLPGEMNNFIILYKKVK